MELLSPDRFEDPGTAYGYIGEVFDQVSSGERGPTITITPSTRHVGVTRRDTHREGFGEAVRAAREEGYPVLVRGAGGGATAAHTGTFGFSVIRPSPDDQQGTGDRYDEAAALVLSAFERLGVSAEVGEVRDEFCPGDHSIRAGSFEDGMKLVGIAQRLTRRATSVGGIVLVSGEGELARVLRRVYAAMSLSFRPETVGSVRRTGNGAGLEEVMAAFSEEARHRYGAKPVPLDDETLEAARRDRERYRIQP